MFSTELAQACKLPYKCCNFVGRHANFILHNPESYLLAINMESNIYYGVFFILLFFSIWMNRRGILTFIFWLHEYKHKQHQYIYSCRGTLTHTMLLLIKRWHWHINTISQTTLCHTNSSQIQVRIHPNFQSRHTWNRIHVESICSYSSFPRVLYSTSHQRK